MFTAEMRRRLGPSSPVAAFAVHPGMVATDVVRSLPPLVQAAYRLLLGRLLLSPAQGARATLHAATSPAAPAQGAGSRGYFGADCRPEQPGRLARDDDAAAWLWRWSAERVGLPAALDLPAA